MDAREQAAQIAFGRERARGVEKDAQFLVARPSRFRRLFFGDDERGHGCGGLDVVAFGVAIRVRASDACGEIADHIAIRAKRSDDARNIISRNRGETG
ncbi:MAG TPA: hypothetical protein VIF33_08235 [Casimicrobiaceae bacterium]